MGRERPGDEGTSGFPEFRNTRTGSGTDLGCRIIPATARKSNGPWFWEAKNGWSVHHQGKRVNLSVKGFEGEAEAVRAWHRLMAEVVPEPRRQHPVTQPPGLRIGRLRGVNLGHALGFRDGHRRGAGTFANRFAALDSRGNGHGRTERRAIPTFDL